MTTVKMQQGETDNRIFFRRPDDDSIYAILSRSRFEKLRRRQQLTAFLNKQRESGVVIRIAGA